MKTSRPRRSPVGRRRYLQIIAIFAIFRHFSPFFYWKSHLSGVFFIVLSWIFTRKFPKMDDLLFLQFAIYLFLLLPKENDGFSLKNGNCYWKKMRYKHKKAPTQTSAPTRTGAVSYPAFPRGSASRAFPYGSFVFNSPLDSTCGCLFFVMFWHWQTCHPHVFCPHNRITGP